MTKKKYLISTSGIIALTLFRIGTIEAIAQEEHILNIRTVNVEDLNGPVNEIERVLNDYPYLFPLTQEELNHLLQNETVTELLTEAVDSISDEYVKETTTLYNEMLNHLQDDEIGLLIVEKLLKALETSGVRTEIESNLGEENNTEEADKASLLEIPDESTSETELSPEENKVEAVLLFSTENTKQSAEKFVEEYNATSFVSQRWTVAQEFKNAYPNDSRVIEIINDAARKNVVEGQRAHRNNNYELALVYYNRVLNENLISQSMRNEVIVYKNNADQKQMLKSADEYYREYYESVYVSTLWHLAQDFKYTYPNDSRVPEVINDAARKNADEGKRAHARKDFTLALVYYDRVLNEVITSNAIRNEVTLYRTKADNKELLKTADEYYKEYNETSYVSSLWHLAQEFKQMYPNNSRVSEVINDAAQKNMIEGQRAHRNKDYDLALVYYNRVLSENLISSQILNDATVYKTQAQGKQSLKTANDYYEDYKKSTKVSELWNIGQDFKKDFPYDSRLKEVVRAAAKNNLLEGQRAHRVNNFSLALVYYNRVSSEDLVDSVMKTEVNVYINQAESNRSLKNSGNYITEYNNAQYVSHLWDISQSFKADFPHDKEMVKIVNDAAFKNMVEGNRAHIRKNYDSANIYYKRVLGEELVTTDLKYEAKAYENQATEKREIKTAVDYVVDYSKTYYVSDLWKISQQFKADYPQDSRLLTVINDAAEKNLNEGLNNHRRKNYSSAAIYYNRVNNEELADISLRNKAEAYYYLAENNMNLTNTIVRSTKYDKTLQEMIDIQLRNSPQYWDTVNGDPFRDATRAEVERYINPANSLPSDLSNVNYLLTTVEVSANILNVRKGPSTMYSIVGKASKGERYTILDKDQVSGWYKISFNGTEGWVAGSASYVKRTNVLQHLKLSGTSGISIADLNLELKGAGILEGMGSVFRQASREANVNELYLIAHALLESGHGSSNLATGIEVNGRTVYNMFGIGAFDGDADKFGSQRAFELGWFTPEAAILGGAKWISSSYINNQTYKQDTLYKMRWNPARPGVHQYATDVRWAEGQMNTLDSIVLLAQKYDLILNFDVPLYN